MESLFGDETITVDESPDNTGQEEETAEETEGEEFETDDFDTEIVGDDEETDESEDDEQKTSPEDGQGDELILGKFKTQDDLANAYINLQREFTKSRQPGNNQQPPAQQQAPAQQPGQPADLNAVFWERFRDDPLGTIELMAGMVADSRMAPILEKDRTSAISQNMDAIAKEYKQIQTPEGMEQLFGKIGEIAQDMGNPNLVNNPSPRILRMAAQEAFGDTKAQVYQKAKQAGRQEAERTRQSKQGLGAPSGAKQQQQGEKTPAQQMKDSILAAGRGGGLFG